ncbi:hypothetical protein KBD81_00800 [Candidatus Woesebacteria bacterium]|nr:hypothetical protein [Candidatus Woesebacteria bacterium]
MNDQWLYKVESATNEKRTSPDFWKLLGFNAILGAQFGYDLMNGQVIRHTSKKWKNDLLSIPHQVALSVYMGSNNFDAWNIKSSIAAAQKYGNHNPILSHGILLRKNSNQNFQIPSQAEKYELRMRSKLSDKPVNLPNPWLYFKLSQIDFSGEKAEKIENSVFNSDIIPLVEPIYREYLDIRQAKFS